MAVMNGLISFCRSSYELKELETIPDLIFKNNLLKEDGLFVLEHGKRITLKIIPTL